MSSSDSEEFESADEDFEDTQKGKPKETLTKIQEKCFSRTEGVAANLESDEELKLKIIHDDFLELKIEHVEKDSIKVKDEKTGKSNELIEEVDLPPNGEKQKKKKEGKKQEIVKEELKENKDKSHPKLKDNKDIDVNKEKQEDEKEDKQTDVKEEIKEIEKESLSKLDDSKEIEVLTSQKIQGDNDEDRWDFDDWGEEGNSSSVQPIKNTKIEKEPVKNLFKNEDNNDDDGWEFDDWGDDDGENAAAMTDKSKMYFPVLDNMSPTRSTKPSVGLMENISKLMPTGSTYDNFPVLNQLTSGSKHNIQEPPPLSSTTSSENELSDDKTRSSVSSNWAWKPWGGVVSLLSTASDGVASLTSHVSSVIESGIGVPDPAEMVRLQREQCLKQMQNPDGDNPAASSGAPSKEEKSEILGNFMYGVTNISNRVISGGLDTLEEIGKKTMTILQENDPGLLKKRKLLGLDNNGPVLSQV